MMALLGMGSNVQCNATIPGYHSSRDLIFGTEGSTRASSNNNIEIQNGHFNIGSLPASLPAHHLEYNKELVKQTILKHEAIFKEQVQELHRLYNRQKELMAEVKRNFDKNLSLGASWSSSFPSHVSTKTPNLPWSIGQSSTVAAGSIQMSLGSGKGNSRQMNPAPPALFPTEGCWKDFKLSHSENRTVGNKLLDLRLPADEYIDSEKSKSLEDEMVSKLPRVSAYTLEGVSQAVCNSDKRPYGANSNCFSNLNGPFEPMKEATLKSDDLMGPTSHRKGPFHDMSMRRELCGHNMSNDAFWNPYKRQDHEVFSDNQPSEKEKKQERPSYMISADQINQGPWREGKFPGGESSIGTTKGPMSASLVQPCSDPYRLLSGADVISLRIPPQVFLRTPGSDPVENQTAVQTLPHFSPPALFDQRSKPLTGLPEPTGDELYRFRNTKSGVHLDHQNFLRSSFCSGSKTPDAPSFLTNNVNSFANQSSLTSHELRKHAKDSEDVETSNNINLNVMPADNSEAAAFQNVKDLLHKGLPFGENKISTQMESFPIKPFDSGTSHGFELMMTEARDCSRKKIHASDINGEPNTYSEQHSFHASPSTVCPEQTANEKIEETEKGCVPDIELPRNHVPGLGDQITAGENLTNNEQERELKCGTGIIDLNISMNEDENSPVDIDFQAPVSPENKESSPPRGESDENQLETSYQLSGQECSGLQLEEARLAAEALVSISESVSHNGPQMITCPPSESFMSSPLHWFARIASSVINHPGNDIKVDFTGNTSDHEEFLELPAGIDYFEAMTLKLTETKSLDFCGKSSDQKEEEGGSASPTRPRKGWTGKGKRQKDFQSEILPSLTSLSRFEVTEDLQTIGGLMEAAGAHSERVSLRGAGRNALARGRRRSSASVSNNTDLLKQQQLTNGVKVAIEKRSLMSWGKANRKPRGKRYPVRNPQVFWSKYLITEF